MRLTYHLTPKELWDDADPAEPLTAPSMAIEGFIHCTDGATEMVATANRHYASDPRPFIVLTVDLDRVSSPWRVEDPGRIYPHIFGPIDRAGILTAAPAPRDADGRFQSFEL